MAIMQNDLTAEERAALADDARAKNALAKLFTHLGFTESEAQLLASVNADPARAAAMVTQGCSHTLATRILV